MLTLIQWMVNCLFGVCLGVLTKTTKIVCLGVLMNKVRRLLEIFCFMHCQSLANFVKLSFFRFFVSQFLGLLCNRRCLWKLLGRANTFEQTSHTFLCFSPIKLELRGWITYLVVNKTRKPVWVLRWKTRFDLSLNSKEQ